MYKLVTGKVLNFQLFLVVKISLIEFAGKWKHQARIPHGEGAGRFYRTDIEFALALALLEEMRGLSAWKLMEFAGTHAGICHPPFLPLSAL